MRKGYMSVSAGETDDETEFVECYWTAVWEHEGGPKGAIEKIPEKAAFEACTTNSASTIVGSSPRGAA